MAAITWGQSEQLQRRDREGYTVLEALTLAQLAPTGSHATPSSFVCIDGKSYWIKGSAQQGLVAELIAGRLASKIGAGPLARVVRVTEQALPQGGDADHLKGVVVGTLDQPGTVNARDLAPFIANQQFDPDAIDARSRALVVTFQTWLGVSDAQVLVNLTNGKVMSIDHGDCFGNVGDPAAPPAVVLVDIPGASADLGRDAALVADAVSKIEELTDHDLVEALSQIPIGDAWQSPADRRSSIGHWVGVRRDNLRGVMQTWTK